MNAIKKADLTAIAMTAGILFFCTALAVTDGCGLSAKQVAKTAFDVGSEACRFAYGQHPEQLPAGISLKDFCSVAENVQPFIDNVLSAQHVQAVRMGTAHPTADAGD